MNRAGILRLGVAALLIVAITMLAFCRCFDYGIINLDDYWYLLGHEEVVTFVGWKSIVHYFTDLSEGIWMPLTWASYSLDHQLFGSWFGGFHLHSVLIHSFNAILVWRLLLLLMPKREGASKTICCLIAALAWAIHPLRCESVVFLASRKDVLSFFWELLALNAWVRGSQCENTKRRAILTSLSVAFFVLGAMCKPSVMTFPFLCLLLDAFVIRSVRPLRYLIPIALVIGLVPFSAWQQSVGGALDQGASEPIHARLAVAMSAFGTYLRNTVAPFWLAPQCIKQWPAWPRFLMPGAILSIAWGGYLCMRVREYWKSKSEIITTSYLDGCPVLLNLNVKADYLFAGMAWFAVAISPMLGLVSFGFHAHADRFTYIPSFGLALLLAVGLHYLVRNYHAIMVYSLSFILIAALGFVTRWQTAFWRDDLTLFSHTLEVDGEGNSWAHHVIAMHHFEVTHDLEKAKEHFEAAVRAYDGAIVDIISIYVITLMELGQEDDIPAIFRQFENMVVKMRGDEVAFRILRGAFDLPRKDKLVSMDYRIAKVATLLGAKPSLKEAKDELLAMRDSYEDSSEWCYLMWRCLVLSGEKEAAKQAFERLMNPKFKYEYLRFRYLQPHDSATGPSSGRTRSSSGS